MVLEDAETAVTHLPTATDHRSRHFTCNDEGIHGVPPCFEAFVRSCR